MQHIHQDNILQRKRWQIFSLVMALIVILCLMIIAILALSRKEIIRYVEFSTEDNFKFKVLESGELSASQKELIIVNQLKEYINARVAILGGKKYNGNEINLQKFNYVKAFSSSSVFDEYYQELKRIHETAEFYKRDIQILSSIKQEENKYLFSFNTIDYYENELEPVINRFSLYIKFDYIDIRQLTNSLNAKLNPLGIKIIWYRGDQETNNVNQGKNYVQN